MNATLTLQHYKKAQGLTNGDIGRALHCSASTAGMILQGRHIAVYHDEQIAELATILGITFERCWLAMCESYNQWRGTPGALHKRADEVRAEVQRDLQKKRFPVSVDEPRDWTVIDSVVAIPEERWLKQIRLDRLQ